MVKIVKMKILIETFLIDYKKTFVHEKKTLKTQKKFIKNEFGKTMFFFQAKLPQLKFIKKN